jgi:hypothetical protein
MGLVEGLIVPDRNSNAAMAALLRRLLVRSESPVDISGRKLAARFRRAVFLLSNGSPRQWQAVPPIRHQLKAGEDDAQAALRYAVDAGWLETQGDPIFRVRLAKDPLAPRHTPARVA